MDGIFNLGPHACEVTIEPSLPALWLVIPSTVILLMFLILADAIIFKESSKLKITQNKKQLGFTFDFWFSLSSPFPLTLAYLGMVSLYPTVTFP